MTIKLFTSNCSLYIDNTLFSLIYVHTTSTKSRSTYNFVLATKSQEMTTSEPENDPNDAIQDSKKRPFAVSVCVDAFLSDIFDFTNYIVGPIC